MNSQLNFLFLTYLKRFYYSYAWSCRLYEGTWFCSLTFFCMALISRTLCRFFLVFSTGLTPFSVLISFPLSTFIVFMYCFLFYFISGFILFHLRFSWSTHLLICLSFETSIISTGWPILVELTDQVNSVIVFLYQMTLLKWLTFILGSLTGLPHSCSFGLIYFFQHWCLFYNVAPHWEILIMFLSLLPLAFHHN